MFPGFFSSLFCQSVMSVPSVGYRVFSNGLMQLMFMLQNNWTLLFVYAMYRISPRFLKWYRKCNPTLFHWATGFFFYRWSKKICILSLCSNIFEHCHFVQTFPPGSRNGIENSIRPFSIRLQNLLKFGLVDIVSSSVRQSASSSVRQSVSPSVRQSFSPSEKWVIFYSFYRFHAYKKISFHLCSFDNIINNFIFWIKSP